VRATTAFNTLLDLAGAVVTAVRFEPDRVVIGCDCAPQAAVPVPGCG
jgi:hypothetical protein